MTKEPLLEAVRQNILDVHVFFVDWFRGHVPVDALEAGFLSILEPSFFYVPPAGALVPKRGLADVFLAGHGANPNLEIAILDVVIQHELPHHLLASYREIQRGAIPPDARNNERLTTVLMTKDQPFRWLSVHETAIAG